MAYKHWMFKVVGEQEIATMHFSSVSQPLFSASSDELKFISTTGHVPNVFI